MCILFYINLFIYLFIFGCVGSSLLHTGFLQLRGAGATLHCSAQASHCGGFSLWSMCSRRAGFGSCSTWAQYLWLSGSRVQAQQLWRTGLVAPRHVGSSQTRARTRVPCAGRQILSTAPPGKSPLASLVRGACPSFILGHWPLISSPIPDLLSPVSVFLSFIWTICVRTPTPALPAV